MYTCQFCALFLAERKKKSTSEGVGNLKKKAGKALSKGAKDDLCSGRILCISELPNPASGNIPQQVSVVVMFEMY